MKILTTILLAVLFIPCAAQEKTDIAKRDSLRDDTLSKSLKKKAVQSAFSPFGGNTLSNIVSNIALSSALKQGENAKIELAYTFNDITLGLSADQKIGKNDKKATFYDFKKGLSPGTTIGFSFQQMYWDPQTTEGIFNKFDSLAKQYAAEARVDRRTVTLNDIAQNGSSGLKKQLNDILPKTPIFWNVNASITKASFTYATDPVSLSKIEEDFITPDIRVAIGFPSRSFKSYLGFNYIFAQSYKAADEQTFYSRFGTTDNYYSRTMSFGKPDKETDHKFIAEWRRTFGDLLNPLFAISPSITYGIKSEKLALAIPVYILKGTANNKPSGLQGGINFGYLTSTNTLARFKDGFGAQIFVSTPFDLFGQFK